MELPAFRDITGAAVEVQVAKDRVWIHINGQTVLRIIDPASVDITGLETMVDLHWNCEGISHDEWEEKKLLAIAGDPQLPS